MERHGVYVTQNATATQAPDVADSGIIFAVGTAPVHAAMAPAKANVPVVAYDWDEAVEKLGYSDDWKSYTLCEVMYSQFKTFGRGPVVFVNVLDPATAQEDLTEETYSVKDGRAEVPFGTINNSSLKVTVDEDTELAKDTDYLVVYDSEAGKCYIELLSTGQGKGKTEVKVSGKKVKIDAITKTEIVKGLDAVGKCVNTVGIIPDLILAPGWSHEKEVAALMATKAAAISGHFVAKALIDLDCGDAGVKTYDAVEEAKKTAALSDKLEIVCWPRGTYEGRMYHMSVRYAGVISARDLANNSPYESPSNLPVYLDGTCLDDGTEILLSVEEANIVESAGVVTALNFVNGWTSWGNFTAAHDPEKSVREEDPAEVLISTSRMLEWIGNTVQRTFWARVDRPMTRIFVDSVVDATNIWLGGLVGNALLGARVSAPDAENTPEELEAGHVTVHIREASPPPARIIDFVTEFDRSFVTSAFAE